MKQLSIFLFLAFFLFVGGACNQPKEPTSTSGKNRSANNTRLPKLELKKDLGIYVETFPNGDKADERFTRDNKIFTPNKTYYYDYTYQKNGTSYKFAAGETWQLVPLNAIDDNTIYYIKLATEKGLGFMGQMDPNYFQSVVRYVVLDKNKQPIGKFDVTGVIENQNNVWLHPIRKDNFALLELNPFPYAKAPYKLGRKYTWQLDIGDNWSSPNWKEWEGRILSTYEYEITGRKAVKIAEDNVVPCWVIEAKASSRLGTTALVASFNEEVGFVQLDYTNIDGSKLVMDLVEVEQK